MTEQRKKVHLLPLLHLLCMLGLAAWWGAYFWQESPSRWLLQHREPTHTEHPHTRHTNSFMPDLGQRLNEQSKRLLLATRVGIADLACGLSVLLLVGLGSGVYVRRIDTWLGARASGHAVAFRGQDLTADALDANKEESRGVLR
jgi:hypothetical protein